VSKGQQKLGKRERAARLLASPPLRPLVRRLPRWRGVLGLNYHRIGDPSCEPWDRTLWSTDAETLDAQLRLLARHAEVVGPEQLIAAQRDDRPGRRVIVTFDDGYRDNYELAFPLLRSHGLTATFFLATGFLDRPRAPWWDEIAWMVRSATVTELPAADWLPRPLSLAPPSQDAAIADLVAHYKRLPGDRGEPFLERLATALGCGRCPAAAAGDLWMTWEMARALRDGGMTIGGHTVTHPLLARLTADEQRAEIDGCAERLERQLGEPMRWFAYPVGSRDAFDGSTKELLRGRDVELAFSFYGGLGSFACWDPLDVPRVHVGPGYSLALLHTALHIPRGFARR
jgi:peptidoglycan/xylan/chitin deacetylase (PgdA/CDA1 family)